MTRQHYRQAWNRKNTHQATDALLCIALYFKHLGNHYSNTSIANESLYSELNMFGIGLVECFYFADEWALDATITIPLQRKLTWQTLLCGCCNEFHCICEEEKSKYQFNIKLDYTEIKSMS